MPTLLAGLMAPHALSLAWRRLRALWSGTPTDVAFG